MQLTLLPGYPDNVGRRIIFAGYSFGPASYNQGTHDPIIVPGFQLYIDAVFPAMSVDGTYLLWPIPISGMGPRANWVFIWTVRTTGVEVGAGVNLSGSQVQVGGFMGRS